MVSKKIYVSSFHFKKIQFLDFRIPDVFQGNRTLSDGLEIYQAMIEDTMQSVKPELVEAMQNYKVTFGLVWWRPPNQV